MGSDWEMNKQDWELGSLYSWYLTANQGFVIRAFGIYLGHYTSPLGVKIHIFHSENKIIRMTPTVTKYNKVRLESSI